MKTVSDAEFKARMERFNHPCRQCGHMFDTDCPCGKNDRDNEPNSFRLRCKTNPVLCTGIYSVFGRVVTTNHPGIVNNAPKQTVRIPNYFTGGLETVKDCPSNASRCSPAKDAAKPSPNPFGFFLAFGTIGCAINLIESDPKHAIFFAGMFGVKSEIARKFVAFHELNDAHD